ncbi:hypothetical protein BGZ93_004033, partial [Podila epicladia]
MSVSVSTMSSRPAPILMGVVRGHGDDDGIVLDVSLRLVSSPSLWAILAETPKERAGDQGPKTNEGDN